MNVFVMIIAVCVQHTVGFDVSVIVRSTSGVETPVSISINQGGELISEFRKKIKEAAKLDTDNLLIKIDGKMKIDTDRIMKSDSTKNITAYEQALPDLTSELNRWLEEPWPSVCGQPESFSHEIKMVGDGEICLENLQDWSVNNVVCFGIENKQLRTSSCAIFPISDDHFFSFEKITNDNSKTSNDNSKTLRIRVWHNENGNDYIASERITITKKSVKEDPQESVKEDPQVKITKCIMHAPARADLTGVQSALSLIRKGQRKNNWAPKSTAVKSPSSSPQTQGMHARSNAKSNEEVVIIANPSSVSQCGPSIIAAIVVVVFVVLMN